MSLPRTIETPEISGALEPEPAPRKHVLDLDDFSREEITEVLESARGMKEVLGRDIKKVPALRGKVVVTLFYEASTRTRISFEEAGKVLSADVINMSASGSSAEKGESLLNTGLTIQAMGVDTIVIATPIPARPIFWPNIWIKSASSTPETASTPTLPRRCWTCTRCKISWAIWKA